MTEIQKVVDEAAVVGRNHSYVWRGLADMTIRPLAEGRPLAAAGIADAPGIPHDEVELAPAGMSDVARGEPGAVGSAS